jgi:hypothetical protein
MTVPQKRLMTMASLAVCSTSWVELDQRLVAAEVADGRDRFPVSTINETLRHIGFEHKKATLYNAQRCPIESARARTALVAYDACWCWTPRTSKPTRHSESMGGR